MASKIVIVGSAVGLHARPASVIAEAAGQYSDEVTLSVAGGDPVDAASALLIMTLGASKGTEVTVESDDPAAVDRIAGLIQQDLDAS
ncbi:HPr family phosphocarrier protein [Brooklawnia cerclae]|uniref:Phosphocarrier protein HPr n=1 Tax=Brooklawnia cerclae TaxID=349934 RepID=A0ABX0SDI5_9ACTN|nr:HPr family phosphocarrier protein [Brooklawnia cerclae]NIH55949.1 phosphocarrier protein [Brooklawnia cerclae]